MPLLGRLAIDWAFAALSISVSSFDTWRTTKFSALLYTGLTSAIIGDVLIAGSLCIILRQRLKDIPGSRTSYAMRLLMAYSIETGALTSACTLACLVTFATVRHNYAYMVLYLLLSKFYLNALLATLNARRSLRAVTANPGLEQPSIPVIGGRAIGQVNDSLVWCACPQCRRC
ncbi:uncharacterized protein B0H18DRAFT_465601 [Fomitopsis serialis]|uniref:uncharacterized protein n=1 Tax=Fomitopsis serialis TaxID=139415 RepID=UPI002008289C|nr:uncharacterized protein B0H18DRAFT_465601 [Neoantrodia serialis]KAH9923541.1 hypothetical protein B0H18DRAFT_465601 [Neoantrodia serialis]